MEFVHYLCVLFALPFDFLLENFRLFSENLTGEYALNMFGAGIIFDTTAILYSNALFILLFLLPFHWKENATFYKVVRWIFTVVNGFFLISNLVDCVYFRFSGRRTTMSVFQEFSNEGGGNLASIFMDEFISHWYLVVLAAVFCYAIYKLYRAPRNIPVYSEVAILSDTDRYFAGCHNFFTVFGMRGGMTTATRPITISNANQYVDRRWMGWC